MTGGLEALSGFTALQGLDLAGNMFSGDMEGLKGCTALQASKEAR
tara:strand:- start:352 stop:486 length:135 start_codon:yes stop_codon:yes gene_type:complete